MSHLDSFFEESVMAGGGGGKAGSDGRAGRVQTKKKIRMYDKKN